MNTETEVLPKIKPITQPTETPRREKGPFNPPVPKINPTPKGIFSSK